MRRDHRLSRRLFLSEFGKGTFAVAVFGTGLAACSSDDDATTGQTSTTGSSETTAGATTSSAGNDTAETAADTEQLRWERVDFGFVSAYVLARRNEIAIVDTGTEGNEAQIESALVALGAGWNDVDHVIVTHAHGDHFGGLDAVLTNAPSATGYAGEGDLAKLSAPRDLVGLNGGDEVFGLNVIATPGHTAGHISVFDTESGLLVAGDSMVTEGGRLAGPSAQFSDDIELANASVRVMAAETVNTVLVGHGDPVTDGADGQLDELAASL